MSCRAKLFPLPPTIRDYCRGSGVLIHPVYLAYFDPIQGPQPADCVREGDHGDWHTDGRGTWWHATEWDIIRVHG